MSQSTATTILHVDDDPECGAIALTLLEREYPECTVVTTTDPEAAVGFVDSGDVDCVVSDFVSLDDGTPFVVAARRRDAAVPILMFTGHEWPAICDEVERASIATHITKADRRAQERLVEAVGAAVRDAPVPDSTASTTDSVATGASGDSQATSSLDTDWLVIDQVDLDDGLSSFVVGLISALESAIDAADATATPLGTVVDVEALYELLSSARTTGTDLDVAVTYESHELLVDAAGLIAVRPLNTVP